MSQRRKKNVRKNKNRSKKIERVQQDHLPHTVKILCLSFGGLIVLLLIVTWILSVCWHTPIKYLPELLTACHPVAEIKSHPVKKQETLFQPKFIQLLEKYKNDPKFGEAARKALERIPFWNGQLQQLDNSYVHLRIILQTHPDPFTGEYNEESWFSQHLIASMLYRFSPQAVFVEGRPYNKRIVWASGRTISDGVDEFISKSDSSLMAYGIEDEAFLNLHLALVNYAKTVTEDVPDTVWTDIYQFHRECIYARDTVAIIASINQLHTAHKSEGTLIIGALHASDLFTLCSHLGIADVTFYQGLNIYSGDEIFTLNQDFPWRLTKKPLGG